MKQTRLIMGMPISVEVADAAATTADLDAVFAYFTYVDAKFSVYKPDSEITLINDRKLQLEHASADMRLVFALAEQTRKETDGYFDIASNGAYDPSGLVKGWAIYTAAAILRGRGFQSFYVDAGGDIQVAGERSPGQSWRVGVRNPFNPDEIVKVLSVDDCGVATSGIYIRGQHIYNPKNQAQPIDDIVYRDVFDAAQQRLGIRTIYALTDTRNLPPAWRGKVGYISAQLIREEVPDYQNCLFYISGSKQMVDSFKELLRQLQVGDDRIKTDFFAGLG